MRMAQMLASSSSFSSGVSRAQSLANKSTISLNFFRLGERKVTVMPNRSEREAASSRVSARWTSSPSRPEKVSLTMWRRLEVA